MSSLRQPQAKTCRISTRQIKPRIALLAVSLASSVALTIWLGSPAFAARPSEETIASRSEDTQNNTRLTQPFDFQLRFKGLSVLAVKTGKDPKLPTKAELFVVKTPRRGPHRHEPILVFPLKALLNPDQLPKIKHNLTVDSYSRYQVEIVLADRAIQLAASNPTGRVLKIPGGEPSSRTDSASEPQSLYWLPSLRLLNITGLKPSILTRGIADSRITGHVMLPYGDLASDDFAVDSFNLLQLFESRSQDGKTVSSKTLIANAGTLTIPGIDDHLEISDNTGLSLKLASVDGSPITVSVVNTPPQFPSQRRRPSLEHLQLLYDLSEPQVKSQHRYSLTKAAPEREEITYGIATPGSEACPVTTYFY